LEPPGDDIIVVTVTQVTLGNPVVETINYGDIEELIIEGGSGNDDITDLRNSPPTTTGISNVTVDEDAPDTVIDLFAAFDDAQDTDLDLVYTIEANSNVALFSGTPLDGVLGELTLNYAADANGTAEITLRATDSGGLFVETTFTVTVNPINDVPVADAGQKQTVLERTTVTLDGSVSDDVDGDTLTFAWVQMEGPTVTLSAPSSETTDFTAPVVLSSSTKFTFQLTVTDPSLASDVNTVTITVNPDFTTDSDGDGITDRVDTQPTTISDDFGDDKLYGDVQLVGGATFGRITDRGDRTFTITDELDKPKVLQGVRVLVDTGMLSAQLKINSNPQKTIDIDPGKRFRSIETSGSSTTETLEGEATLSSSINGTIVSVTVDAGDVVTFDETPTGELTVVQSGTGLTSQIEMMIDGQTFIAQLDLGESITYTISAIGSITVEAAGGDIDLEIDGSPVALPAGDTLTTVGIDIKPGGSTNSINLGSKGTIPVAIFSTADFDATTVDPTTVTLAEAKTRLRGKGTPMASLQDVNGDGLLDLVVHVETEALQLTETDSQAQLTGETYDGVSIVGTDFIRVVAALHVAGAPAEGVFAGNGLTHATLNPIVQQSLAYWAEAGVVTHRLDALMQVNVQIADLSDSQLGIAALDTVWIDRNAAGYGWSLGVGSNGVELFSTVTHEFGHVLGLRHHDSNDVMDATLALGSRHGVSSGSATETHGLDSLTSEFSISDFAGKRTSLNSEYSESDRIEAGSLESLSLVPKLGIGEEDEETFKDWRQNASEIVLVENGSADSLFAEFNESLLDDLLVV
jgi:hypothetical protein